MLILFKEFWHGKPVNESNNGIICGHQILHRKIPINGIFKLMSVDMTGYLCNLSCPYVTAKPHDSGIKCFCFGFSANVFLLKREREKAKAVTDLFRENISYQTKTTN